MSDTVVIIQARMGSSRLPGKVLKDLAGKPVVDRVIERARAIPGVDRVVVATTDEPADDVLARHLASMPAIQVFRGSENDVLDRYVQAARQARAKTILRVTSDCPLLDPGVSGAVLKLFRESGAEYASNGLKRTHPRGLDTEVFSMAALERAHREAHDPREREHVTYYIWNHPELYRLAAYAEPSDHSDLRWTVDTEEDYRLVREIYSRLHREGRIFTYAEALALFEREPELARINAHIEQKKV